MSFFLDLYFNYVYFCVYVYWYVHPSIEVHRGRSHWISLEVGSHLIEGLGTELGSFERIVGILNY